MLLDEPHPVNVSSWGPKVTLERPTGCRARGRSCDFLQLPNPYSSMWLLSRERLQHFITTPLWRCASGPKLRSDTDMTVFAHPDDADDTHGASAGWHDLRIGCIRRCVQLTSVTGANPLDLTVAAGYARLHCARSGACCAAPPRPARSQPLPYPHPSLSLT